MDRLLAVVLLSAVGCGGASPTADATTNDDARVTDGAAPGPDALDASSVGPDTYECPHRVPATVAARAELCVGGPRFDPDAGIEAATDASIVMVDGGTIDPATCELDCNAVCQSTSPPAFAGPQPPTCDRLSATQVRCVWFVPCGRATEGVSWSAPAGSAAPSLARWLDDAAFLEAVAVRAFERLAEELAAHGAPAALVERAYEAADDERRHTVAMRGLAGAYGAPLREEPRVETMSPRSLETMATENAVEGCVRETYGALQALHQASHAEDPAVRAVLAVVAREECAHAALAWDIARWSLSALDEGARDRVLRAHAAAWDDLERSVAAGAAGAGNADPQLGLPSMHQGVRLAQTLRATLAA